MWGLSPELIGKMQEKQKDGFEQSAGANSAVPIAGEILANNVVMNGRQGHGFAAEKMNHLYDQLLGKDAKLVGGNNAKNGADRLVDGVYIQTKFCETASRGVSSCIDPVTKKFKYGDKKIEVPKGQAAEARSIFKTKISKGEVVGLTEAQLDDLFIESPFTYKQAQNVAKAGTIEGLTLDAANAVTLTKNTMGITAALTFAVAMMNGKKWSDALNAACFEAICAGGIAWISSIATAQVGRTFVEGSLRSSTNWLSNRFSDEAAVRIVAALRGGATDVAENTARDHLSKLIRGNVVAGVVTTAVLSTDDFILLFQGRASGAQTTKSVAKTASGVAGGTAGWTGGAIAGASIGSMIPFIGTAIGGITGGLVGAALGGGLASAAAGSILDEYIDDDSKTMLRKIERIFGEMAEEQLLTEIEAQAVFKEFMNFDVPRLLQEMFARGGREGHARDLLLPLVNERVAARPHIQLPSNEQLVIAGTQLLEKLADDGKPSSMQLQEAPVKQSHATPVPIPVAETSAPAPAKKMRSLESILDEYDMHLTSNFSVFALSNLYQDKAQKKLKNAVNSYAHDDPKNKYEPDMPLVLVDFTALGSAKDGMYITEDKIYIKPSWEERKVIRIKEITRIHLDEDDRKLRINGREYGYVQSLLTPETRIIVKCLNKYLEQFQ